MEFDVTNNSDESLSQSTSQKPLSYSAAASSQKETIYPSKLQAVVFNSLNDVKLEEYLLAVGSLVSTKHIIFSSRITNNRICIYFSTKQVVDEFFSNSRGFITVNNTQIQVRRLITPSERLLISNVSPTIPHKVIENELLLLGLKPTSSMSFLRIGTNNPEYKHVLSFRRHIYVSPPTGPIPDSILITHEDTTNQIFLSLDNLYFLCKQHG
uniref:Uncharacterized protein LOC114330300 n=1 Tax=Diabrotica virgifera virgifera TaxID=50390 RepID=A0A6P7FR28_DIAVI